MLKQFVDTLLIGSILMLAFETFFNPKKVNITANKWLSVLLFMTGFIFMGGSPMLEGTYKKMPFLNGIDNYLLFLIAPVLYLTIRRFIVPNLAFQKKEWVHFIPFFIFLPLFIFNTFQNVFFTPNELEKLGNNTVHAYDWVGILLVLTIVIQGLTYWFLSYRALQKHNKNINLFASKTDNINLNWLKYILLTIAAILLIWFIELLFELDFLTRFSSILYFICIYVFAYFIHKQEEIFPYSKIDIDNIKELIEEQDDTQITTKQKRFSDEQLLVYKNQLTELMQTQKIYLDDEMSLPKLAALMSISPNDLSYLINEGYNENFFQFINTYRVEEAKKLLLSDKYAHLNILGLAYEAGFASKSTFNATFKKMTGYSPSDFQKNQKNL
jgi:AraC-like DNA-binding protein